MVDFNNENTVAQSATDIMRVIILESRYNAREAIETYIKQRNAGMEPTTEVIRARLWSLWSELRSAIIRRVKNKRGLTEEEKNEVQELIETIDEELTIGENKFEVLLSIYYQMNSELDTWKLTAIDTREIFDTTRVDKENKAKDL